MKNGELHRFEVNGEKLVLDVESDALHLVDEVGWDIISHFEQGTSRKDIFDLLGDIYGDNAVEEAIAEVQTLRQNGLLWAKPYSAGVKLNTSPPVKALCLNIAHDCNLSCRYCFASEGSYGKSPREKLMPAEIGRAAIDFLLMQAEGTKHLEIDYFGGEPLLNMEVIKDITAYGRQKEKENGVKFHFTLTTNGLLLREDVKKYLGNEEFSVILSLDGRPQVHDRMRVFPNGSPSYAEVKERLQQFVEEWEGSYYVRGTFTRHNRDFSRDVAHLFDLGFRRISLEPVIASFEDDWALSTDDLPVLAEEYQKLAAYYLEMEKRGDPFSFFHFEVNLEGGPCVYKRLSGCGAGDEYLAVTPTGYLYPCHQLVEDETLLLGNVQEPHLFKKPSTEIFPPAGPLHNECRYCWARYHCGGGCRAAAKIINGSFTQPSKLECALQKKRLECALYLKACNSPALP